MVFDAVLTCCPGTPIASSTEPPFVVMATTTGRAFAETGPFSVIEFSSPSSSQPVFTSDADHRLRLLHFAGLCPFGSSAMETSLTGAAGIAGVLLAVRAVTDWDDLPEH